MELKMKKNSILKIVNPIIALLLLCQIFTALFKGALGRHAFEGIHTTCGLLLVVGGILHLVLNWNWVKTNYF